MAAPNNQEQLLLELINETRMDPMGAASRYILSYSPLISSDRWVQAGLMGVTGNALQRAFEALLPTSPVAWNNQLADAATGHSQLIVSFDQQSHQLPGEASVSSRANNAGYNSSFIGECVFSYAQSMLHAIGGFMVDWGPGADGMQTPAGHRLNTMDSRFREIGLGVISDFNVETAVGPYIVTEDFGTRYQTSPEVFLLGVSYADLDGDHFYSVGEGRAGMNVSTTGGAHQTSASGGYTVELAAGVQNISFDGGGLASPLVITTDFASGTNAKIDVRGTSTVLSSVSLTVISGVSEVVALGTNSLRLVGASGHQLLHGNVGGNALLGLGGDDTLVGGAGNDILDGGTDTDTAVFSGSSVSYALTKTTSSWIVSSSIDGTDTLTSIERLQFSDKKIALDLETTGNAGQAMEFIGAVAPALLNDASIRGAIIFLFDQGYTMEALSQWVLDQKLLPTTSNADLANAVYHNVIGGTAPQDTTNGLVGYIDANGQANFLATVARLHINVDLVGLQQTGVEYLI